MKAQVLFIDHEPYMLKALERTARRLQPQWSIITCTDGLNWQQSLNGSKPDVVFCSYLMPGKRGEVLLAEVRQTYPTALRVLLTGSVTEQIITNASRDTHFIIGKPFDAADIANVFQALSRLKKFQLPSELQAKLVSELQLPVLPHIAREMREKLKNPDIDIEELATLVSKDSVISARIVMLANSAFLGFKQQTFSLPVCIMRLGINLLDAIVTAMSLESGLMAHIDYRAESERTFKKALISQKLASSQGLELVEQEKIFTAVVLSGLGLLAQKFLTMQHASLPKDLPGVKAVDLLNWFILTCWGYDDSLIELILASSREDYLSQDEATLIMSLSEHLVRDYSQESFEEISKLLQHLH